jgi:hypothetical protein
VIWNNLRGGFQSNKTFAGNFLELFKHFGFFCAYPSGFSPPQFFGFRCEHTIYVAQHIQPPCYNLEPEAKIRHPSQIASLTVSGGRLATGAFERGMVIYRLIAPPERKNREIKRILFCKLLLPETQSTQAPYKRSPHDQRTSCKCAIAKEEFSTIREIHFSLLYQFRIRGGKVTNY